MRLIRVLIILTFLGATGPENPQGLDRVQDLQSIQRSIEENTLSEAYRKALKLSCQNHATLTYAALRKGEKQAILQVYGDGCGEQRSIFVFEQRDAFWSLASDLRLSSHYDEQPVVTFPTITESDSQDLMVEHQTVDWGTGFRQKNITVFKWIDDHFEVVLDAPEWIHASVPFTTVSGQRGTYELEQNSTFQLKDAEKQPGVKQFTEHQTIRKKNREITRVRNWIWEPSLKRFRCFEGTP
jgi:hypothetical protein